MGDPSCRWVRDRLPLLTGDELRGLDRRRVERHVIGCSDCRQHQESLVRALSVLHQVGAETPFRSDAPSLWPELARQIRESRRPAPSWFALLWARTLSQPAIPLALGLSLAIAACVGVGTRQQTADAYVRISNDSRPLAPLSVEPEAVGEDVVALEARPEPSETPVVENTPPARLDYVLDRAVPMPVDGRDSKQPTY